MRARRSATLLLAVTSLAVLVVGCLGETSITIPEPSHAASYRVDVEGEERRTMLVHLLSSEEPARDGQVAQRPVLRLELLSGPLEGAFLHYPLTEEGVSGVRTVGDLEARGTLTSAAYDMDLVIWTSNMVDGPIPRWTELGSLVWGQELSSGDRFEIPVETGNGPGTAQVSVGTIEGGCAGLRLQVVDVDATIHHCEGEVLPERIRYRSPVQVEARIQTLATGGPRLPAPPQVEPGNATPVEPHPPDGSGIELPLETAVETLRSDPRSGPWLEEHPDAVAVSGWYRETGCSDDLFPSCPAERFAGVEDRGSTWTLNWTASDGDWLEADVTRPNGTDGAGTPAVTRVDDGAGRTLDGVLNRSTSLARALDLWRTFHDASFHRFGISYDLTADEPVWRFHARKDPTGGTAVSATVEVSFDVEMRTGLVQSGWVAPLEER